LSWWSPISLTRVTNTQSYALGPVKCKLIVTKLHLFPAKVERVGDSQHPVAGKHDLTELGMLVEQPLSASADDVAAKVDVFQLWVAI